MISRTYVVVMPSGGAAATPVNIFVQDDPGTSDDPVVQGTASYYEWRGRPIRFETVASDTAANGFVPRLTLGFSCGVVPLTGVALVPLVAFSQSLVPAVGLGVSVVADPGGLPAIVLTGSSDVAGHTYLVSLQIMEAKDEDRTADGV